MSSSVLDFVREKEPRFKDEPDDALTFYVGRSEPSFLKDPEFKKQFDAVAPKFVDQKALDAERVAEFAVKAPMAIAGKVQEAWRFGEASMAERAAKKQSLYAQMQAVRNEPKPKTWGGSITGLGADIAATVGSAASAASKAIGALTSLAPPFEPDETPGWDKDAIARFDEYKKRASDPVQRRKDVESQVTYEAGKVADQFWAEAYQHHVPEGEQETVAHQIAQTASGLVPAFTGRAAPFLFGLMAAGRHFEEDYQKAINAGASPKDAELKAERNAAIAGAKETILWMAGPPIAHKVVAPITSRAGQGFVERLARNAITGSATLAPIAGLSQLTENVISGDPIGQDVLKETGGGAMLGGVMGGMNRRPMRPAAPTESIAPTELGAKRFWANAANIFRVQIKQPEIAKYERKPFMAPQEPPASAKPVVVNQPDVTGTVTGQTSNEQKQRDLALAAEATAPVAPLTSTVLKEQVSQPVPVKEAELPKEKGAPDAVQERSAAQVPVEKPPGDSEKVGEGTPAKGQAADAQKEKEVESEKTPAQLEKEKAIAEFGQYVAKQKAAEAKPEVAAKPSKLPLRPTLEIVDGEEKRYYTGRNHDAAIAEARAKGEFVPEQNEHMRKFLDSEGNVLSQEEATKRFNELTGETPESDDRVHSEDIKKAGLMPESVKAEEVTAKPGAQVDEVEKAEREAIDVASSELKSAGLPHEVVYQTINLSRAGDEVLSKAKSANGADVDASHLTPDDIRLLAQKGLKIAPTDEGGFSVSYPEELKVKEAESGASGEDLPFARNIATINRKGQIVVDPVELRRWTRGMDPAKKQEAINSLLSEESVHAVGRTIFKDEDYAKLWKGLTGAEQALYGKLYLGKEAYGKLTLPDHQMGDEVLRMAIQRLNGMGVREVVESRAMGKGFFSNDNLLDMLGRVIQWIRLHTPIGEQNRRFRSMVDQMQEKIAAAKETKVGESVEFPFARQRNLETPEQRIQRLKEARDDADKFVNYLKSGKNLVKNTQEQADAIARRDEAWSNLLDQFAQDRNMPFARLRKFERDMVDKRLDEAKDQLFWINDVISNPHKNNDWEVEEAQRLKPIIKGEIDELQRIVDGDDAAAAEEQNFPAAFYKDSEAARLLDDFEKLGIKPNAKGVLNTRQAIGTLRNRIHPDEWAAYEAAGISNAFGDSVRPSELASWMKKNGPRVQVIKQDKPVGIGTDDIVLRHWYESLSPKKVEQLKGAVEMYYSGPGLKHALESIGWNATDSNLAVKYMEDAYNVGSDIRGGYTAAGIAAPKSPSSMQQPVDLLVKIPEDKIGNMFDAGHYSEPNVLAHVRGYTETVPTDGRKAFFAFEVQSDWGQEIRKFVEDLSSVTTDKKISWSEAGQPGGMYLYAEGKKEGVFVNAKIAEEAGFESIHKKPDWSSREGSPEWQAYLSDLANWVKANPRAYAEASAFVKDKTTRGLLRHNERLALKAAIEHAKKTGSQVLAIPDSETAMMSEGHDQYLGEPFITAHYGPATQRPGEYHVGDIKGLMRDAVGRGRVVLTGDVRAYGDRPATVLTEDGRWIDVDQINDESIQAAISRSIPIENPLIGTTSEETKEPHQAGGMRLHYDNILPRLARELTGDVGTPFNFGKPVSGPSPIFKDRTTGEPKNSITGTMYDLSEVGDFSLFSKGSFGPTWAPSPTEIGEQLQMPFARRRGPGKFEGGEQERMDFGEPPKFKGGEWKPGQMMSAAEPVKPEERVVEFEKPEAVKPEERASAEAAGALPPKTALDAENVIGTILSGYKPIPERDKLDLPVVDKYSEANFKKAKRLARPSFKKFSDWVKNNMGNVHEESIREMWYDGVHNFLKPAPGPLLEKLIRQLDLESVIGTRPIASPSEIAKMKEGPAQTDLPGVNPVVDLKQSEAERKKLAAAKNYEADVLEQMAQGAPTERPKFVPPTKATQAGLPFFTSEAKPDTGFGPREKPKGDTAREMAAEPIKVKAEDWVRPGYERPVKAPETSAKTLMTKADYEAKARQLRAEAEILEKGGTVERGEPPVKLGELQREAEAAQRRRTLAIRVIANKLIGESEERSQPLNREKIGLEDIDVTHPRTLVGAYREFRKGEMNDMDIMDWAFRDNSRASDTDPVTVTKRIAVLENKRDGKISLVSAYPEGHGGTIKVFDPSGATGIKGKPHRELKSVMAEWRPRATMLLRDPVKEFYQGMKSWSEFVQSIGKDAKELEKGRAYNEMFPLAGESDPVEAPSESEEVAKAWEWLGSEKDVGVKEQEPKEPEVETPNFGKPLMPREAASIIRYIRQEGMKIESPESLKSIINDLVELAEKREMQVGKPIPKWEIEDAKGGLKFPKSEEELAKETARKSAISGQHYQMISALDKMTDRIFRENSTPKEIREMNELQLRAAGERAYLQALDEVYNLIQDSEYEYQNETTGITERRYDREGFTQAALGRFAPEARPSVRPAAKPAIPGAPTQAKGVSRDLTMAERRPPTVDPNVQLPKGPGPEPELPAPVPPTMSTPDELAEIEKQAKGDLVIEGKLLPPYVPTPDKPIRFTSPIDLLRGKNVAGEVKSYRSQRPPVESRIPIDQLPGAKPEPKQPPMEGSWSESPKALWRGAQEAKDKADELWNASKAGMSKLKTATQERAQDVAVKSLAHVARGEAKSDIFRLRDGYENSAKEYAMQAGNAIRAASMKEAPAEFLKRSMIQSVATPGKWSARLKYMSKAEAEAKKLRSTSLAIQASFIKGTDGEIRPSKDRLGFAIRLAEQAMNKAETMIREGSYKDKIVGREYGKAAKELRDIAEHVQANWADPKAQVEARAEKLRGDLKSLQERESSLTFASRKSKLVTSAAEIADAKKELEKVKNQIKYASDQLKEDEGVLADYGNGKYDPETGLDNEMLRIYTAAQKELSDELAFEQANGSRIQPHEAYIPGYYDGELFDDTAIHFGARRLMGKEYRKPKSFSNYYQAIASGPYIPASTDIADIIEHRIASGRYKAAGQEWARSMKNIIDPVSGEPMAVDAVPVYGENQIKWDPEFVNKLSLKARNNLPAVGKSQVDWKSPDPKNYELIKVDGQIRGTPLAVRIGYAKAVKAAMLESRIRNSPIPSAILNVEGALKHGVLLIFDTFHPMRLSQYALSMSSPGGHGSGKFGAAAPSGGFSALMYRPGDMEKAVKAGLITKSQMDWALRKVKVNVTRMENGVKRVSQVEATHQDISKYLIKQGLNATKISDALYRDAMASVPILNQTVYKWTKPFNKWVFDTFVPGIMVESAVHNFLKMNAARPDILMKDAVRDVVKDVNIMYGNMGRQGIFKDPTWRDMAQILLLAPSWQEGLLQKDLRFAARLPGMAEQGIRKLTGADSKKNLYNQYVGQYITGRDPGLPAGGALGKAIGAGLVTYLAFAQAVNLAYRGKFTWQNEEPGHELDAYIPSYDPEGNKRPGHWLSVMSVFAETFHDVIRLMNSKPTFWHSLMQIGLNKSSPMGRAANVMLTAEDPSGEKLTSTGAVLGEAAKQVAFVSPISVAPWVREAAHAIAPGMVHPNKPGVLFQRAAGSLGWKLSIEDTDQQYVKNLASHWVRDHNLQNDTGWVMQQNDHASYSKLRSAVRADDIKAIRQNWNELLKAHNGDEDKLWTALEQFARRPFTGREDSDWAFYSSLTHDQQEAYFRAEVDRQNEVNKLRVMLTSGMLK